MNALRTTGWLILVAIVASGAAAACGEDGASIGSGECPAVPLYQWKLKDPALDPKEPASWQRIGVNGQPLSAAENKLVDQAQSPNSVTGNRCLTPIGTAVSIGTKVGTGGAKGSGGSTGSDAAAD